MVRRVIGDTVPFPAARAKPLTGGLPRGTMSVGNPMLQGPKRSIAPVIFTVFLDLLGFGIVIPILAPLFLDRGIGILAPDTPFGVRTAILGALISIFSVMQFFGAPVFGALSDRYGRKPML